MNYDADKELINANASNLGKLLMGYKFVSFKDIGSWFTTDGYEGIANWCIRIVRTQEVGLLQLHIMESNYSGMFLEK